MRIDDGVPGEGFIAWDGNTYQGQPPAGWYKATDGRWWPEDHPTDSDPFPALNEQKGSRSGGVLRRALMFAGVLATAASVNYIVWPFLTGPDKFEEAATAFRDSAPWATGLCCNDVLEISLADDTDNVTQGEATALVTVLDELGFSRAVVSRMDSTRALDGTQTAEGDLATAYWTYHPDNGLNVIFEPKG